jgi:hypothetical protein
MLPFLASLALSAVDYELEGTKLILSGSGSADREGVINKCPRLNFTELEIKDGVTSINEKCFAGARKLKTVTITAKITDIAHRAFENCSALESFNIPATCKSIGNFTFVSCKGLINVTYTKTTYQFGEGCFEYCNNLIEFKLVEDPEATEAGEGFIERYAFFECKALQTIDLPPKLVNISEHVFHECLSIQQIVIPSTVKNIDRFAFYHCAELKSIDISSLETITDDCFGACTSLTSVVFGEQLQIIKQYAFTLCDSLKNVEFPEKLAYIGKGAFTETKALTSISFPTKCTYIHEKTFQRSGLHKIFIPMAVIQIDAYAFAECINLVNVTFESGTQIRTIASFSFQDCGSLSYINPGNELYQIGFGAFQNTAIKTFFVNELLSSIGARAFAGCTLLESFTVSPNNKVYSQGIDGALYDKEKKCLIIYPAGAIIENPQFEPTCTEFGESAFHGCAGINTLKIPASVTTLGDCCFLGSLITELEITSQFSIIPNYCFKNCHMLEKIHLAENVASLQKEAFCSCIKLESIKLPKSLTIINERCFMGCTSLTEINLEKVTDLGSSTFQDCTALRRVVIPNMTVLLFSVFQGCTKLDDVNLPSSLKYIYKECFMECISLKTITLPRSLVILSQNTFFGCSALERITIPPHCRQIQSHSFDLCTSLKEVVCEGIINTIDEYAFRNCTSLERIKFMNNVLSVSYDAFRDAPMNIKEIIYCGKTVVGGDFLNETENVTILVGDYYPGKTFASKPIQHTTICIAPTEYPTPSTTTPQTPLPTNSGGQSGGKSDLKTWQIVLIFIASALVLCVVVAVVVVFAMKSAGWRRKETLTESLLTQTV